MSVQCIHASEWLLTPFACERPVVGVQLLVTLAIVLPGKAFATPWPLALEWLLLVMGPEVTCSQVRRVTIPALHKNTHPLD